MYAIDGDAEDVWRVTPKKRTRAPCIVLVVGGLPQAVAALAYGTATVPRVDKIVVSDLKDDTFYALIYLSLAEDTVAIDARPSDAIADYLASHGRYGIPFNVVHGASPVPVTFNEYGDESDAGPYPTPLTAKREGDPARLLDDGVAEALAGLVLAHLHLEPEQPLHELQPRRAVLAALLQCAAQLVDDCERPSAPDVPTTAELGMPDVSYTMWHGLYVAKGTPKETIGALNSALRKALSDPGLLEKLKQLIAPKPPHRLHSPSPSAPIQPTGPA